MKEPISIRFPGGVLNEGLEIILQSDGIELNLFAITDLNGRGIKRRKKILYSAIQDAQMIRTPVGLGNHEPGLFDAVEYISLPETWAALTDSRNLVFIGLRHPEEVELSDGTLISIQNLIVNTSCETEARLAVERLNERANRHPDE